MPALVRGGGRWRILISLVPRAFVVGCVTLAASPIDGDEERNAPGTDLGQHWLAGAER